jgi:hypothetical protein
MIATGTLCFIVKSRPLNQDLLGRVVTVTGPATLVLENSVPVHPIDAEWLRAQHPRCHCYAEPSSLLPIAGPDRPSVPSRKLEPEKV